MKETKTKLKKCSTCNKDFNAKRVDSFYCSRLCYRRNPVNAALYSKRTSEYQKKHSREISRRFKKLKFKCTFENKTLNISLEQYTDLLNKPCFYCKKSILNETGCSLDRLDNSIGYNLDNVVTCCGSCNQIKNIHLTHQEMIIAMEAVLNFRERENNGDNNSNKSSVSRCIK